MSKKCQQILESGKRCNAFAIKGGQLCYFHKLQKDNPEKLKEQQSEGGTKRKLRYKELPEIKMETPEDARKLIEELTNLVRQNQIADKKAILLQKLADAGLKAIEMSKIEPELEEIREHLSNSPN